MRFPKTLISLLSSTFGTSTRRGRRRPTAVDAAEALECRTLLTVLTWDGDANVQNTWSTPGNWKENRTPVAGDDLVFPSDVTAFNFLAVNNLPVGTVFNSIEIDGNGYVLDGNRIDVGAGGLKVSGPTQAQVVNEIRAPLKFSASNTEINVLPATQLNVTGVVSGDSGVIAAKTGSGRLRYAGTASNTFAGITRVKGGTLELHKTGTSVNAIVGPLEIGQTGQITNTINFAFAKLLASDQIRNDVAVSVLRFGRLNLNGFNEAVGPLEVSENGIVEGSTSKLTLTENVTTRLGDGTFTGAAINVPEIFLGGRPAISTNFNLAGFTTLTLNGAITGSGFRLGSGTVIMAGTTANTYAGTTVVAGGELQLAKSNGVLSVPGDLTISRTVAGGTASVRLISQGQVFGGTNLTLNGTAILDLHGRTLGNAGGNVTHTLTMTGGSIVSSSPDGKINVPAVFIVHASPTPSTITAPADFTRFRTTAPGSAAIEIVHEIRIDAAASLILEKPIAGDLLANSKRTIEVLGEGRLQWGKNGILSPGAFTGVRINGPTVTLFNPSPLTTFLPDAGLVNGQSQTRSDIRAPFGESAVLSPGITDGQIEQFVLQFPFVGVMRLDLNGPVVGQYDRIFADDPGNLGTAVDPGEQDIVVRVGILDIRLNFASAVGDVFTVHTVQSVGRVQGVMSAIDQIQNPLTDGEIMQVNGQSFRVNYTTNDFLHLHHVVLTHVNSSPAFQDRTLTRTIVEGEEAVLTGRITEPDTLDTFFLDVDWGDGILEKLSFPAGTDPNLALHHRYLQDGQYNVNLSWHDQHNTGFRTAVEKITVRNSSPVFHNVTIPSQIAFGTVATLRGTLFDQGTRDTLRLTIKWGDGSQNQEIVLDPSDRSFTVNHNFARRGRHWITLVASDESGHSVRHSLLARVR